MKRVRWLLFVLPLLCGTIAVTAVFWLGKNVFDIYDARDAEIRLAREVELTLEWEERIFRDWRQFCDRLDALPPETFSAEKIKAIAGETQFRFPAETLDKVILPRGISGKIGAKFSVYRGGGYIFLLRKTDEGKIQGCVFSEERLFETLGKIATKNVGRSDSAILRVVPVPEERGFGIIRDLPGAKIEWEFGRREWAESVAATRAVWIAGACIFTMLAGIIVLALRVFVLSEKRYLFASAVSHELKTPIAELKACAENALEHCKDANVCNDLTLIKFSAQELNTIVENLLAFSRMKDGKFRIVRTELSVEDVFSRIFERIADRLLAADTDAVFDIEPRARERRLQTSVEVLALVLFNLADNAVKYARRDDTENVLTFRVHTAGHFLFIDVEDTGPGIPPEIRACLFKPFERGQSTLEKRGLGLGLAIASQAIKQVGGELSLHKSDVAGTTFRITLPLPI